MQCEHNDNVHEDDDDEHEGAHFDGGGFESSSSKGRAREQNFGRGSLRLRRHRRRRRRHSVPSSTCFGTESARRGAGSCNQGRAGERTPAAAALLVVSKISKCLIVG